MQSRLNKQLFNTSTHDSGALGMMAMVIHPFGTVGRHRAVVMSQGRPVAEVEFDVDATSTVMQHDIDLAQVAQQGRQRPEACACKGAVQSVGTVSPKGFVLFHASSGHGHSVVVNNADGKPVFDSTVLNDGDLFAVSLLEPTRYTLQNAIGAATGEIEVVFNDEIAKRIKQLEPRYVEVQEKGFDTDRIELASTQGLVFRIKGASRIVIEKQAPHKADTRQPVIRWQKPPTPSTAPNRAR
ncbi:hypothetical protein ACVC7V_06075 [Hydrogenophaga sp. A37]|uniref:hypothetical protein n=1 Tax=Hydrogenophaga sp. A37 TaxID=1945864 RepID=UPI000985400A|nr:hypothetical protein [Hydrogenophaga sp. A37]OOG79478.1 hypothetical protein B0E41_23665 [Hydrogenophaga sp. A37]